MLNPVDQVLRLTPLPPIKSLDELAADPPPEPPLIIHQILHQGSKMILGGGSKGRKSWMLMDLAVCASAGLKWWGFPTEQTPVLHLNFELQEYFAWSRFDWIRRKHDQKKLPHLKVWNLRGHAAGLEDLEDQINTEMSQHNVGMLIIDPLYKILGDTDENDNSKIGKLLNRLEHIAVSNKCAIVFAHHFRKGGPSEYGSSMDRLSGAGTLAREPDAVCSMQDLAGDDQDDECVVVESWLRNLPPVAPFGLKWDCPLFTPKDGLDLAAIKGKGGQKTKGSPEQVRNLIPIRDGLTKLELVKRIESELKVSNPSAYRYVNRAFDAEKIKYSATGDLILRC